jgi:protein-disulfide isomerase
VIRLFKGIPQSGTLLGKPSAPVTMVEYIDLQCPVCRAFETETMPAIIDRYVRTGKVKVEARPIAFIGQDSVSGRLAAIAASKQNRFFDFAQVLYANQGTENSGWLDDTMITAAAKSIPGVDVPALLATRNSAGVAAAAKTRSGARRRSTSARVAASSPPSLPRAPPMRPPSPRSWTKRSASTGRARAGVRR